MFEDPAQHQTCPYSSIIITYNSENEIDGLLSDLLSVNSHQPVIIIDNASQDGTVDLIEEKYPQVLLIKNETDIGYARAVNQAFKLCTTEYFFLLNPDIRLPDVRVADTLLDVIEKHPDVAAVAPVQYKELKNRTLPTLTWSFFAPRAFSLILNPAFNLEIPTPNPIRVTYLNAGCLFIRSSAFQNVGMLNEKYFLYGEEPDLFLKFKRFNYPCLLLPDAFVIHQRENSMKSLSNWEYLSVKMQGSANIMDALINGWVNIIRDQFTQRLPFRLFNQNSNS